MMKAFLQRKLNDVWSFLYNLYFVEKEENLWVIYQKVDPFGTDNYINYPIGVVKAEQDEYLQSVIIGKSESGDEIYREYETNGATKKKAARVIGRHYMKNRSKE